MPKIDIVNAKNIIESNPEKAFFKLKNTGGPKGDTGAQGPQGPKGDTGPQGPAGLSSSVTVGSTTTLSPGADATVTNSGDTRNAILNFGIPTGAQGPQGIQGPKGDTGPMGQTGAKGDTGAAATVQVGNTNTGAPGTNAQVTNAGNEHFAVFNFTIPRGDKGEKGATGAQGAKGDKGDKGDTGAAATITVGSTTTTNPGTSATVTNSGSTSAAVLNFGIPRGATGSVKSEVVSELPETGEGDTFYLVNREATTQTATGKTINFTNSDNSGDITDFKLDGETSQNGTPTPSAPVAVSTTTGENVVKISDGQNEQSYEVNLGKNLFDKDNANVLNGYIDSSHDYITSHANNRILWIKCEPNTQYVISVLATSWNRAIAWSSDEPAVGVQTFNRINLLANSTSATFTTGALANYIVFRFWASTLSSETYQQAIDSIQIEKGSQATSYAPYFTPIELCKIGDYQDSIYKSGGKWYVHKAIGKVIADGNTVWAKSQFGANNYGFAKNDVKDVESKVMVISDQTTGVSYWDRISAGMICYYAANQIFIRNIDIDTAADLTTHCASNPMTFYYVLATPADTEITNQALIAQLDNVASAPLYTGVNNITTITPNEQGTLEIKYVTYDKYNQNKVYIWNDTLQQWQIIVQ